MTGSEKFSDNSPVSSSGEATFNTDQVLYRTNNEPDSACDSLAEICRYREELEALRQQVVKDPLTGLFNMRYFQMALEREIERAERSGGCLSMAMVDLDHFKRVNDTWGHEAGNRVLKAVADVIVKSTRKIDVQCRYGGEEFAVLLPGASASVAAMVGERLRNDIAHCMIEHEGQVIRVTASVGVATISSRDQLGPQLLTKVADQQLYLAKQSGRNCVRGLGVDVIEA